MKLEEEIKQDKGFRDQYHKTFINIVYTAAAIKLKAKKTLKAHGISVEQYNVLRILRGQHPKTISVKLIQERMLDKSFNASRLVERLRENGLVARHESKVDRRKVEVFITKKGLKLLADADQDVDNQHNVLRFIPEENLEVLNEILDRLRE